MGALRRSRDAGQTGYGTARRLSAVEDECFGGGLILTGSRSCEIRAFRVRHAEGFSARGECRHLAQTASDATHGCASVFAACACWGLWAREEDCGVTVRGPRACSHVVGR